MRLRLGTLRRLVREAVDDWGEDAPAEAPLASPLDVATGEGGTIRVFNRFPEDPPAETLRAFIRDRFRRGSLRPLGNDDYNYDASLDELITGGHDFSHPVDPDRPPMKWSGPVCRAGDAMSREGLGPLLPTDYEPDSGDDWVVYEF